MLAEAETAIDGARAMLEHRGALTRNFRLQIVLRFFGFEQRTFDKRRRLFQDRIVARDIHVKRDDVRQP